MALVTQFCLQQTCRTVPSDHDFRPCRISPYCRPVCMRNSLRPSDDGVTPRDTQKSGFFKLQLSHRRFQSSCRRPQKHVAVPQASSSGELNNPKIFNVHSFTLKAFSLSQMVPTLQSFPWDKAYARLKRRISDLLLIFWKWVALPVLVVMAIKEILFTISVGKELFIPIGLLAGSVLAGILTETALTISNDFQESVIQWYLFALGAFFAIMKFAGIKCFKWSYGASAFLVHFANGGLWQTIRFSVCWKRCKAERPHTEGVSAVGQRQR